MLNTWFSHFIQNGSSWTLGTAEASSLAISVLTEHTTSC